MVGDTSMGSRYPLHKAIARWRRDVEGRDYESTAVDKGMEGDTSMGSRYPLHEAIAMSDPNRQGIEVRGRSGGDMSKVWIRDW